MINKWLNKDKKKEDNYWNLTNYILRETERNTNKYILLFVLLLFLLFLIFLPFECELDKKYEITTNSLDSAENVLMIQFNQDTSKTIKDSLWFEIMYIESIKKSNDDKLLKSSIPFLIIFSSYIFLMLTIYIFRRNKIRNVTIYCTNSNCHKAILVLSIKNLICPVCNLESNSIFTLLNGCKHCSTKLKYIECPHCRGSINLFNIYNHEKIKQKIYNA